MQNKVTHIINRGVAQLVARDIWDVDAAGSNPVTPTTRRKRCIACGEFFINPPAAERCLKLYGYCFYIIFKHG